MPQETATHLADESRMAEAFVDTWLKRDNWTLDEWVDDFIGLNLPLLPPDEPYIWILEGLGTRAPRAERTSKLAKRLAQVLESGPDRGELDEDRTQALYNVLVLCSEIRKPEILAGPLMEMLYRAKLPDIPLGYNLRFALRQALMMNPPGRELEPLWVGMAQGEIHPFLPPDRYDAFHGVLLLPVDETGEYAVTAMSAVLKALAEALERDEKNDKDRHDRFAAMLGQVTECWGSEQYLARFWRDSFVEPWPGWASMCVVGRFGLPEPAVDEIGKDRSDIELEVLARVRAEVFIKIAVFALLAGIANRPLVMELKRQRIRCQREAGVPVGRAA